MCDGEDRNTALERLLQHEGGWQLVRAEHGRVLAIPPSHTYGSWTRAPDGVVV
jgi:hypothetical protein